MMQGIEPLVPRQLFGGAIVLSTPERLVDVSDFRPVPDNQETPALISPSSSRSWCDASAFVAIQHLIKQESANVPDEDVASFMFTDLANANDALSSHLEDHERLTDADVPCLAPGTTAVLAHGQQQVSKGRQGPQAANTVQLLLAIVRLPAHGTDLVLTLNTPVDISPHSAAAEHVGSGTHGASLTAPSLFRSMLRTLAIHDYALFGN